MHANNPIPLRRIAIAMLVVCVAAAGWAGCSIEKHYKTLTFFFDGVPDPNAPTTGFTGLFTETARPILVVHEPFENNGCNNHHTNFSDLSEFRGNAQVCLSCHEDVTTSHERMHGPVVAQVCLWCHNPHQSPYPHLLRESTPEVCQQCHLPVLLERTHRDDPSRSEQNCLQCHSGHGGSGPGFLLEQFGSGSTELTSTTMGPDETEQGR